MTDETATNPVAGDDLSPAPGVADTDDATIDLGGIIGDEADGEGGEGDAPAGDAPAPKPEDDVEEIERGGQKYKVPKALLPELLMQEDYTKKTQALAEQRRILDEATQAVIDRAKAQEEDVKADIAEHAAVHAMGERLKAYDRIDWRAWTEQDPAQANAAWMEYQQLKDAKATASDALTKKTQERAEQRTLEEKRRTEEQSQADAKLVQEGYAAIKREFPDWSPDVANKTLDFGQKVGGFTPAELNEVRDPRMIKVLHLARIGQEAIAKQRAVTNVTRAQTTTPVPVIAGTAAATNGEPKNADEWVKWRNKQVAERRKAERRR